MKRQMEMNSQHCWKFIYKHSDISIFAVCHRFYFFYLHRSGKNIFTNKSSSSGIYRYFNSSVRSVRKKSLCRKHVRPKNGTYWPTKIWDSLVYWPFKITCSYIGFEWEKSDHHCSFCAGIHPWNFFHERVRGFTFHQCKYHFNLKYCGRDKLYGSFYMKIDKEGPLNVWQLDHLEV